MPRIILGIDPGVADTGFGVITQVKHELTALDYGSIQTQSKQPMANRLEHIFTAVEKLIKKYKPEIVAVEQIFFHTNVTTAMAVSQARGVILLAAARHRLTTLDCTPLQVKQALSGYGRADKRQIQTLVKIMLKLKTMPKPDDAADALAVAICCAHSRSKLK
ncbi:MAG TPA: crossover junction endodeoxyribonuclease RuvC [Candidatus Saccharimonadales bacterium]